MKAKRLIHIKMPSLATSGFAAKVLLRFVFVLIVIPGPFALKAQKTTGTFLFSLLSSGHKIQQRPLIPETAASVFYDADTLTGAAKLTGDEVVFTTPNDPVPRRFRVADEKLRGVQFQAGSSKTVFVKRENKGKLFRLLFDAYGLKIYDDAAIVSTEPGNINYSGLLFEYGGRVYPAVTFWTTSTKRNLVKILNEIFRLSLQPKDFKNKEAVMAAVLNYDDKIFSSKK